MATSADVDGARSTQGLGFGGDRRTQAAAIKRYVAQVRPDMSPPPFRSQAEAAYLASDSFLRRRLNSLRDFFFAAPRSKLGKDFSSLLPRLRARPIRLFADVTDS